ncbi:MAG: flagellar assembly protein FliW [Bdellovibrionales bacterium]|nr:flagellar assembly protein FliW [Bdellovibrionales bacterium]
MRIQTSRFGSVELTDEDILTFPEGLLGFTGLRKFVLLDDPNDEIFAWMQSCENPGIAFPILEPELFAGSYTVELSRLDLEIIEATKQDNMRYFSIVTIPEDPTQMTANLKAPIVINVNKRKARQCVLQDNNLAIREPIFAKLQQRVVQNPSTPIKVQSDDLGITVRLPNHAPKPGVEV